MISIQFELIQVVVLRLSSECDDVRPILPKNENAQNFGFFSVENGEKSRLFSFQTKNTENAKTRVFSENQKLKN